jgi:hypothetical protein
MNENEKLNELYKKHYYPNVSRFYRILKENEIKKTLKEVKEFISLQAVNQIHKPIIKKRSQEKSIVSIAPNEQLQIDLLDYSKYSNSNKNFSWILIGIDVFTRKAYAEPIKNKTPISVLNAFQKFGIKPFTVIHDDGNEYKGAFLKYIKENDINTVTINSKYHSALSVVDRFSRTLKSIIEKEFTANNTVNWINSLSSIVENYNETPHTGIRDIKPNDADETPNKERISSLNFWKAVKNNELAKPSLKIGDSVRIQTKKTILSKGFSQTYSSKVYKIIEIYKDNKVKLDDEKIVNVKDLIIVPAGSESINDSVIKYNSRQAKINRRLKREGLT